VSHHEAEQAVLPDAVEAVSYHGVEQAFRLAIAVSHHEAEQAVLPDAVEAVSYRGVEQAFRPAVRA
jgi:hypothetical protein